MHHMILQWILPGYFPLKHLYGALLFYNQVKAFEQVY